jgi:hypothetical protein
MQQRRQCVRMRTFLGAQIAFNARQSVMDCLIRDYSDDGARIAFPHSVTLPDEFDLYVRHKQNGFRARTIWRTGDEIGVRFVSRWSNGPIPLELARRVRKLEAENAALRRRIADLSTAE